MGTKIIAALKAIDQWPAPAAKDWAFGHYKNGTFKAMAAAFAQDVENHFGLKGAGKDVQDKVVEALMKDDQIEKLVRAWAPKYLKKKENTNGTSGTSGTSSAYLTN